MRWWILVGVCLAAMLSLKPSIASAIDFTIDYTYDTDGFFSTNEAARNTLEAAADFYSQILDDTFISVTVPPPFESQEFDGVVTWNLGFRNPTTDEQDKILSATIAANEYRIYAGARSLPGPTAGTGSKGSAGAMSNGGGFTQQEINEINQIDQAFRSAVDTRGEAGGFATWGGAISIDTDADNHWHFDHLTPPAFGEIDLYSVALHELGHALGLGNSTQWTALIAGTGSSAVFTGAASIAAYGSGVPMAFNYIEGVNVLDPGHWRDETMSSVFGGTAMQEVVMDPSITLGTRKLVTKLDAAGLMDIGWSVVEPGLPGDFNHDNSVDAADYTVWRNGLGSTYKPSDYAIWRAHFGETLNGGAVASTNSAVPEPITLLLFGWGCIGGWLGRRGVPRARPAI